jgi:hypothetical protein
VQFGKERRRSGQPESAARMKNAASKIRTQEKEEGKTRTKKSEREAG